MQFCEDKKTIGVVGTKFFKILGCKKMHEIIDASEEGISHIHLNIREAGSITNINYFQNLQIRWFGSIERKDQERVSSKNNDGGRIIESSMHVEIEISEGKGKLMRREVKDFIVASVATKTCNRWYMCEKYKQTWKRNK